MLALLVGGALATAPIAAQDQQYGFLIIGAGAANFAPLAAGDTLLELKSVSAPRQVRASFERLGVRGVGGRCTRLFTNGEYFLYLLYSDCPGRDLEDGESGVLIRADGVVIGPVHAMVPLDYYREIRPPH